MDDSPIGSRGELLSELLSEQARWWDAEAATFDDAADHGLRDPGVRAAWAALMRDLLPAAPARVADLGCGTGSLAALLAGRGYAVDAIDLSGEMITRARAKTAGLTVTVAQADAAHPPLRSGRYDVVLTRHLLWALPDPAAALARWVRLLTPGGRLVLVEGRWWTGAGLSLGQTAALVEAQGRTVQVRPLTDPALWGGPVDDERYAVVSPAPD